jgi:hypothetical protein
MTPSQLRWKAALVFRIWRAVENNLGTSRDWPRNFAKLSEDQQQAFRVIAASRIPAIDEAWNKHSKKRCSEYKSQYKCVGLHPGQALGRTR